MSKQKRVRLEIIKDILGLISLNRGIFSTKLMEKANLSPKMFEEYIDNLIKIKLINMSIISKKNLNGDPVGQKHRSYNLTKKGRQYLDNYHLVNDFLEKYGLNEE